MAKRKRGRNKSKCPEPINTLLDIAGALTLGLYAKHKIKKDFEKGIGEESANAAGIVFGIGSMRKGSSGIISLGGLIGLNSALRDIEKNKITPSPFVDNVSDIPITTNPKVRKYLWRYYCEDGTEYNINPTDYETADEYADALANAKQYNTISKEDKQVSSMDIYENQHSMEKKHVWRKYCEDGTKYGIDPMDYETADDYEEALSKAKNNK